MIKRASSKKCRIVRYATQAGASSGNDVKSGQSELGYKWSVHNGDASVVLREMPSDHFGCVVTSPPYYSQRDYGANGQIGLEKTIDEYVSKIVAVFDEVKRVLSPDGTLFLNLGDTYYSGKGMPVGNDQKNGARRFGLRPVDASGLGVPRKTAIGIPWRVALGMIGNGWTLRSPIVWKRTGAVPEPTARDRPWRTYETVFLFTKSPSYYFCRKKLGDEEDIWDISTRPKNTNGIHSAAFPEELVKKCLEVGSKTKQWVLDPFAGSGTVLRVALKYCRNAVGIDINKEYCKYMIRTLQKN